MHRKSQGFRLEDGVTSFNRRRKVSLLSPKVTARPRRHRRREARSAGLQREDNIHKEIKVLIQHNILCKGLNTPGENAQERKEPLPLEDSNHRFHPSINIQANLLISNKCMKKLMVRILI